MALKYFLIYAGSFLGFSLLLLPLIRQVSSSFINYGKKPLLFNLVSSVLVSGIAFGVTYISHNLFFTYFLLSAVFLLFGTIFMFWIHRKFFKARKDNRNKQFFAEILYAVSIILLCVAVFSSLQYFLKDKNFMFFPMLLCMLFFFVPILLLHTFDAAISIPSPVYNNWQYPVNNTIELPDEDEKEHLYVIGFEIQKKFTDSNHTYFRAKAPEHMILGDLFYHFINDYNDLHSETPIEYANENNVQDWVFRTKPKWNSFSKILNPERSVNDNKIKENTVIICERVEM